jgi:hypothetical protein
VKRTHKVAAAIAASLALGLAASAFANPGGMGQGANARHAAMHGGKMGAMRHAGQSLMTPEERQKHAQGMREEMQKRAQERGTTPAQQGEQDHTH